MLGFDFSEEQKSIQKMVRDYAKKKLAPLVRKIDDEKKIPDDIIKDLADMGLLGMSVSKDYGGIEADPITVGIVAEELARGDITCAVPTFFLVQAAWGYVLNAYGREGAKKAILPLVTKGEAFLGIAATEPDAGSDLAGIRATAKKSGSNYILNGEKTFISGTNEVANQLPKGGGYVTIVKTDPSKATRGMSLFYIPLRNARGVTVTSLEEWGRRGVSAGGFVMEDVAIPQEYLLGEENRGFYMLVEGFDYARAIISVICAGVAMSALEHAVEYLKIRKTFGQPIARYEGIQFKLAEHWSRLEALRLLGYRALWLNGKEHRDKSVNRFLVTKASAEAKMLGAQFSFDAINDAIQWFGAFGYTVECPLELALKGVRSYWWAEGALEIMKIIVARELLGKEYI